MALNMENKVMLGRAGAIPSLVSVLSIEDEPVAVQHAAGALKNLAINQQNEVMIAQEAGGIPLLVNLLNHADPLVQEQAAGALRNLAHHPKHKVLPLRLALAVVACLVHPFASSLVPRIGLTPPLLTLMA